MSQQATPLVAYVLSRIRNISLPAGIGSSQLRSSSASDPETSSAQHK